MKKTFLFIALIILLSSIYGDDIKFYEPALQWSEIEEWESVEGCKSIDDLIKRYFEVGDYASYLGSSWLDMLNEDFDIDSMVRSQYQKILTPNFFPIETHWLKSFDFWSPMCNQTVEYLKSAKYSYYKILSKKGKRITIQFNVVGDYLFYFVNNYIIDNDFKKYNLTKVSIDKAKNELQYIESILDETTGRGYGCYVRANEIYTVVIERKKSFFFFDKIEKKIVSSDIEIWSDL